VKKMNMLSVIFLSLLCINFSVASFYVEYNVDGYISGIGMWGLVFIFLLSTIGFANIEKKRTH